MPDSNPLYDLVGGYYPGEPLPRRRPNYTRPTPVEFNPDAFIDEYMAEVKKDVQKLSVSEQAKKYFIDDIERALVIQVQPKNVSYDPMRALELGDEEDVAGVQVKLDINPVKWIKNPKEMLEETVTTWVKDVANWKDFDAYAERKELYTPLLKGESKNPIINYAYGKHIVDGVETDLEPFQLIGTGTDKVYASELVDINGQIVNVKNKTDVIKKTAKTFQSFNAKRRSSGSRNGAFDNHVVAAANATAFEIKNLIENNKLKDNSFEKAVAEDHLQRARVIRTANNILNNDTDIYFFGDEVNLNNKNLKALSEKGELYGQGVGFGLKEVTGKLELFALGKRPAKDAVKAWNSVFQDKVGPNGAVESLGALSKAKKILDEADAHFKSRSITAYSEFQRDTKPFRKLISRLENYKEDTKDIISDLNVSDRAAVRNMLGKLDVLKELYSREGPVKGGLQNMNRKFAEHHLLTGPVADLIFSDDKIIGSKNVLNVTEEALFNYKREDFYDLLEKLEKDGVVGVGADLGWSLVRKRLDGNTPAKYVKEGLKRVHNFGLKYEPEYGPGGEYEDQGVAFVNNIIKNSRIFENKHKIKINGIGTFNFVGNENLKLGFDLYERTLEDLGTPKYLDKEGFLALINADSGDLHLSKMPKKISLEEMGKVLSGEIPLEDLQPYYSIMFDYGFFGKDDDEIRLIIKRAGGLRKWLKEHDDQLELEWDANGKLIISDENYKKLHAIFKKLSDNRTSGKFTSFTDKFAAPLQKFAAFSNRLQTSIFEFLSKSKVFTTISYAQNVVSKAARTFVKEALMGLAKKIFGTAVTAMTGGVGAAVVAAVEIISRVIFKKVRDLFKKFAKAFRKKGIGAIEDMMEEGFQSLAKTSSYIVGGFSLGCLVPSLLVATVMLGAITPVDTTKMTPGMAIGPGGILEGDCDWSESETTGLSSSDPIVSAAIEIADPLEKGYWCLWNKQTQDYPNYWNEYKFRSNPFPSATFDCYDCLFWCTRLVIYSHREAGYNFRNIVNSQKQKNYMARRHEYFKRDEINASDLQPGDVVFFQTPRVDRINHVAIVSDVGSDTVETIHSNAWVKVLDLTVDVGSGKVQDYNDMKVIGFGRWKR